MENKKKRRPIWLYIVIGLAVLLGIQYIVDGPAHGDKKVAKMIERLQADSIALQGNLSPMGKNYTHPLDIVSAVDEIYDYGNPIRFNPSDSTFMYTDSRTAPLAMYNKEKCREVLNEVLPMWRRAYALAMNSANQSPKIVCQTGGDNDNIIYMYSPKYIDEDKIKDDYMKYGAGMKELGFKEACFALSPNSLAKTYNFK